MKLRAITYLMLGIFLTSSCKKEKSEIFDLKIKPEEITRIELRGDHKTLIPNGISKMNFYTKAYATRTITSHNRDADGKFYTKEITEEFLVPNDQVPTDLIKVFGPDKQELKDLSYSTTKEIPNTKLPFYAEFGSLKSNTLEITIREIPKENYEEIIVPVVFHMLIPPTTAGPTYEIKSEFLKQELQRISDVFNRKVTTDPNGGNAKITFKLAIFDQNGLEMQEPGKNIDMITAANMAAMGTSQAKTNAYKEYILKNKTRLIWDPNKYLNVWLCKFTTSTSFLGNTSYVTLDPHIMHSSFPLTSIPGLTSIKHQDKMTVADVTDCLQAGVMVNYTSFYNPSLQGTNDFNLSTVFGKYYGLMETYATNYTSLKAGDSDYLADTYSYSYSLSPTVYKSNVLSGQPEKDPTRPLEYFTSYNVMDVYSRKSSITVDQANRIRTVIEQCPSRWHHRSNWAFTGR